MGFAAEQIIRSLAVSFALYAVERYERSTFLAGSDHDPAAVELRCIESVQGLSQLEKHEIGDVHQVVFGG